MPTTRHLHVVPLEGRETPATLIDASTVTYRDVDGDSVAPTAGRDERAVDDEGDHGPLLGDRQR